MLAQALAGGMSLEGVGEALSIGAAVIHLRTSYGNPMDTHLQTGINTRRYLLGIEGVSLRNKILALLTWHTGPEISSSLGKFDYDPREDVAALPPRSEAVLLEAITESIESQPHVEDLSVMKLPHLVAAPQVRETLALTQQYLDSGYDVMALFDRLGEITVRDDFSEMHAFKHHQATVEEYINTREPFRWVQPMSAAKIAAIVHGKRQENYQQAKELIGV